MGAACGLNGDRITMGWHVTGRHRERPWDRSVGAHRGARGRPGDTG